MTNIKKLGSTMYHPSGRKMVMLGGVCYKRYKHGDIICEVKWVDGEGVMILYKSVLGANTPAYMIEHRDAHLFAQSNGYAAKKLLSTYAREAAIALNSEHDKATIGRIIDVILNCMEDLIKIPPEPRAQAVANQPSSGHDELSIKVNGKTVAEIVI